MRLVQSLILCACLAGMAPQAMAVEANSGAMPSGVSVVKWPSPITENAFLAGILNSMLFGECFLETIELGVDTCPWPVVVPQMVCVRITCNWPYGFMEGSDRYGHTAMKVRSFLEHLEQVLPQPEPEKEEEDPDADLDATGKSAFASATDALEGAGGRLLGIVTKDLNPFYTGESTSFGRSGERISQGIGRAGPPPQGMLAIAAIISTVSLGNFCSFDFILPSIAGRWWVVFDADRGFTSAYRGLPSAGLLDEATSSAYWKSLMITLWFGGADVLGLNSYGQSSPKVPRSAVGFGAQVVALTTASANAWGTAEAPLLFWGYLHWSVGGWFNRQILDTNAYTPEGSIANTPNLVPFATLISNLWPGANNGCPSTSCDLFTKTGEMGTNAQFMQIPMEEGRNWNKSNRAVVDKNMAVLIWPKITCCRLCMISQDAPTRHFNDKIGDEYWWALAPPWSNNKSKSMQEKQDKRNKDVQDNAEQNIKNRKDAIAKREARLSELETKYNEATADPSTHLTPDEMAERRALVDDAEGSAEMDDLLKCFGN